MNRPLVAARDRGDAVRHGRGERVKKGAELLCEALEALGVEHVFGVPGTQNVELFGALRRSRIRVVVASHELAASFMAVGYYRASGKVAPLLTIPGPGFTYALTGLAEARHDSAAVVHLTGQPPSAAERSFQFQALDQRGMAAPVVKGALRVDRTEEIGDVVADAFDLALGGEPGPVLVELSARALQEHAPAPVRRRARRTVAQAPDPAAVEEAAALLAASRHPLIMAGQGCAGAPDRVRELAELLGAPVFTTTSGRGVLPEDHALALGFEFDRGDLGALNELIGRSDCVLAIGCKLTAAGTHGFALDLPGDRLIHVDSSADVLGATYRERLGIVGSADEVLERLSASLRRLRDRLAPTWSPTAVEDWRRRLRTEADGVLEPAVHGAKPATAAAFFAALGRALPRDAIVVTDSGLHQSLVRRHWEVLSPRGLLVPSDFQSMGFGLPAAIGAKLAAPGRVVVAVLGDGGFAMSGLELLTAVRERAPLLLVVFNDGQLNRIRLQQLAQFGRAEGCEVLNPDFAVLAEALGVGYARCDAGIEDVLRAAAQERRPTLVEVRLGDSAGIHLMRAKGLARAAVHEVLGAGLASRLKRMLTPWRRTR